MWGQATYYPYFPPDSVSRDRLAASCKSEIVRSFVLPPKVRSDYKKTFIEQRDDNAEYVESLIRNTATFDTLLYPFLQSVAKRIREANPQMRAYTFILSDWPMMNAFYVGGNTIVVCLQLLSRMDSEDQVAAILCHELAHGEMDHVLKGLTRRLDNYYSKDFQKELKRVLKEEFNVNEKINMLALKFTLGTRYHDRSVENAADSLGYLLYAKTGYDPEGFVDALEALKHVDEPAYADSLDYAGLFNCTPPGFDFDQLGHYKRSSIFEREEESQELTDSLRTHPGCDQRIASVRELMKSNPAAKKKSAPGRPYDVIRRATAMESIMALYNYEFYDYSLFNALVYFQQDMNNEFLSAMITLNWYKLYEAMQAHELSDFLSNYSLENPGMMDDFLYLVNHVRLSDIREFNKCFVQAHPQIRQREFQMARDYCTSKMNSEPSAVTILKSYAAAFRPGRFSTLMKEEPASKKKKK